MSATSKASDSIRHWPLDDKPFTAALLSRHQESLREAFKWAKISRLPVLPAEFENATVLAAGSLANEITSRASRELKLPLWLPGTVPSRELYMTAVFHTLVILGLLTDAQIEGVAVGGRDVGPAFVLSAMPLHSEEERVALALRTTELVREIVEHRERFAQDLFKISRAYCMSIPAQAPEAPARFPTGVSADELLAVLLRHLLQVSGPDEPAL